MVFHLNLDWTDAGHQDAPAQVSALQATVRDATGQHHTAHIQGRRLHFSQLAAGFYTLHLTYTHDDIAFDSFAFGFEVPDITLMKCLLTPEGTLIEQSGTLNDYGEFMEMGLSEEPLYLTRAVADNTVWTAVTPCLLPGVQASAQAIDQALGPLAQAFVPLQQAWAYQLRALLRVSLLEQASVEALAVLQHLLSNHLALMDDERLHERLLVAIEAQGASERVEHMLEMLQWNPTTQSWDGLADFLQALGTRRLLK